MNNIEINKGKDQMKNISLTKDERSKILQNISLYADLNMPIPKPDIEKVLTFWGFQINTRLAYVITSILFIILIGGGTVYASENSIPGDLLYPIKTKITEPIKTSLAKTPEAKAKNETNLTERRLKEAETLEKRGKLTAERKETINKNIDNHLTRYVEAKNEVKKDGGEEKVKTIETDFDNKMKKYSEIINRLERNKTIINKNPVDLENDDTLNIEAKTSEIQNRIEGDYKNNRPGIINLKPREIGQKMQF